MGVEIVTEDMTVKIMTQWVDSVMELYKGVSVYEMQVNGRKINL